jgi:hypothetical protein
LNPVGETAFFASVPAIETAASEKAKTLRARALRYRQLCAIFYNQDLVTEVECLARELEEKAAKLEIASYSFFQPPMRLQPAGSADKKAPSRICT